MLSDFFKKKKGILTPEDQEELRKLKREAYMNKARELVKLQGELQATQDIQTKPKMDYS